MPGSTCARQHITLLSALPGKVKWSGGLRGRTIFLYDSEHFGLRSVFLRCKLLREFTVMEGTLYWSNALQRFRAQCRKTETDTQVRTHSNASVDSV
jgi:hypothetical protein